MNVSTRWHRVLVALALWACAWTITGCDLFHTSGDALPKTTQNLPQLQPQADAIQLEIVFLERPVGDRLFGSSLWNEVDTNLSGLEPEEQRDLAKNGFQVGVAGNHPPAALQKLLELRAGVTPQDQALASQADTDAKLVGKRIFIRSGDSAQVQLNETPYPEFKFLLFPSYAARSGEWKTYGDAKCLFRVTVERDVKGWARLDFVPEIQYGQELLRPQAGENGWEMLASPLIEKFHKQRFSVHLNTGDMALISCRENSPDTLAHRLFCGPEGGAELQRLLLIRLAHTGQSAGPFVAGK